MFIVRTTDVWPESRTPKIRSKRVRDRLVTVPERLVTVPERLVTLDECLVTHWERLLTHLDRALTPPEPVARQERLLSGRIARLGWFWLSGRLSRWSYQAKRLQGIVGELLPERLAPVNEPEVQLLVCLAALRR